MIAASLQAWQSRTLSGPVLVVDGDTIRLDGQIVRLRGIDAPELDQTCTGGDGAEHACGRLSARHLEVLIGESAVACSGHDADRYGRFLGDCLAGAGTTGTALNRAMVEAGWAVAFGGHERAEATARADNRGMWAWTFERPSDWRRRTAIRSGEALPTPGPGALFRRVRAIIGLGGHNE